MNSIIVGVAANIAVAVTCFGGIWALGPTISGQARVIDGDTIEINRQRIRIWGIDAPELSQQCEIGACGRQAAYKLQGLIQDHTVECYRKDTDRYHRMVARCEVQGDVTMDIGEYMVCSGWAVDYTKYSGGYYAECESYVREHKMGMFAGSFQQPSSYRHR